MKVYFNRLGNIDHVDCTSAEFIELQDGNNLLTWVDLADIPECLGETIEERIKLWVELKKKGIIIENIKKHHGRNSINGIHKMDSDTCKGAAK